MTGDYSSSLSTPGSESPARILIVDDHPMMREGLSALLSAQSDLVACGAVANFEDALKHVHEDNPHLAIIDIALNGENGLELVRRIKAINPRISMLVLSMYDDELYAERALDAGARGYLNKHVVGQHIISAIRQLLAGKRYLSEEMEVRLSSRDAGNAPTGQGIPSLTNRELEVFKLIGAGMSTVEIAEKLFVSVKTVETHRQKIKLKLGLRNSAQLSHEATHFVLENG